MRLNLLSLLLLPLLAVCGCGAAPTRLASIRVTADADANDGHATALDVVFVFSTDAVTALPDNGPEWFQKRGAVVAGLAKAIQVAHVQLPPGMATTVALPTGYGKAIGVYSFANYIPAPGQARGNLTPYVNMTIRLANSHVAYANQ